MTKQNVEAPEIETLGEVAKSKTELFFEENGKRVVIAIVALIVVATALFSYKMLVMDPAESKAEAAIYAPQLIFEAATPDYQIALDGDGSSMGFLEIVDTYGSTAAGNLARHYAGVCYVKLGEYDLAKKFLTSYKPQNSAPAKIIYAQNLGLQGDIAVNEGDYATAVTLFESAAATTENPLTTPLYLRKAGQASKAAGDVAKAKVLFEKVMSLYPTTIEARNADKLLGTIK